MKPEPIRDNEHRGFHYSVTAEQIEAHGKLSVQEKLEWVESTNKFIYSIQTDIERQRLREVKNWKASQ